MDELGGAARRRGRHGAGGAVALGGLRARFAGRLLHGADKTKKMVADTETVGSGADWHGQLMIGSVNRSGSSTGSGEAAASRASWSIFAKFRRGLLAEFRACRAVRGFCPRSFGPTLGWSSNKLLSPKTPESMHGQLVHTTYHTHTHFFWTVHRQQCIGATPPRRQPA